jgi:two-component system, LuxR family, sensor kinase FixL
MRLERLWQEQNRTRVLVASGVIILLVALLDWRIEHFLSMGFLYLFPIMLAAAFLPRWLTALLGIVCGVLAEMFSYLDFSLVRTSFVCLGLAGCGLFVGELIRNRRLSIETQAQLKALVETSPAAIVTVDDRGFIELANRAAVELMLPRDSRLIGHPIAAFLPDLHHALRWEEAPQFRAAMQCRGHRGNGEAFTADVWFSTYRQGETPKVAAIVTDITENEPVHHPNSTSGMNGEQPSSHPALNERETEVLRLLVQGLANKQIASRLEISASAVKNAMQQLFAKTGVRTRSQLVRVALQDYREIL